MSTDEQNLLTIRGLISTLSASEQQECYNFADNLRKQLKEADQTIGVLAFTLVGMEMQIEADKK